MFVSIKQSNRYMGLNWLKIKNESEFGGVGGVGGKGAPRHWISPSSQGFRKRMKKGWESKVGRGEEVGVEETRGESGSFSRTPTGGHRNSSAHYIHRDLFYCGHNCFCVPSPDPEAAHCVSQVCPCPPNAQSTFPSTSLPLRAPVWETVQKRS